MFSDLYYVSKLIDKSFSFSKLEKQIIFNDVKNNPDKIKEITKIFEDERIGLKFIKNDYENKIIKIGDSCRGNLIKDKEKLENKKRKEVREKMKDMKQLEQNENREENIDNLINQI